MHNLLFAKHAKKRLDVIFFPMVDKLHTPLVDLQGSNACPTVTVTPETVKAAFTKESDVFAEQGVAYLDPLVDFSDRKLLTQQLFQALAPVLGLSAEEHARAVDVGFRELAAYESDIRTRARVVIDQLERENRVGIVVLARPYHHDPGLNHEILEEFQKLGYPVFSQSTLPLDQDLLERLFGDEACRRGLACPGDPGRLEEQLLGEHQHKVWAAKFTARHPTWSRSRLSSFRGGHDAPITRRSNRSSALRHAYFSFKDIDENKPTGSIESGGDDPLFPEALPGTDGRAGARRGTRAPDRRLRTEARERMREHDSRGSRPSIASWPRPSDSCRWPAAIGRRPISRGVVALEDGCHRSPELRGDRHRVSRAQHHARPGETGDRLPERCSQHPQFLTDEAWPGDGERHWPVSKIWQAMRGWAVPFLSRACCRRLPSDHRLLFTGKCNLDCHYCYAYDNRVRA